LCGLEAALQLKDKYGCTITVISMGPPQAEIALREALAMGCDEAYLISDRLFGGADTWATSATLAGAIKKIGYDLIITGRQAIDGDTAQVGPQIAEHLTIPQVTYARAIEKVDGENAFIVERQFDDRYKRIKVKAPCLITALSTLNNPRYMSVNGIVTAYDKEIPVLTFEDLKDFVDEDNIGLKGSPTQVKKSYPKSVKAQGTVHKDVDEDEAVELIIAKLKQHFII